MVKKYDLTGVRVGKLTVICEVFNHKWAGKHRKWLCRCDCGNEREMFQQRLSDGTAVSCGCANKEITIKAHTTHGMSKTPIYGVWVGMISRCSNEHNAMWHNYGGRGISVCSRWRSFENFYADMGDLPYVGAEIDRIDNDGNYEPGNCKWATRKEQTNNTRRNVFVEVDGVVKTVAQWSEQTGISHRTLAHRAKACVSGLAFIRPPNVRGQHASC